MTSTHVHAHKHTNIQTYTHVRTFMCSFGGLVSFVGLLRSLDGRSVVAVLNAMDSSTIRINFPHTPSNERDSRPDGVPPLQLDSITTSRHVRSSDVFMLAALRDGLLDERKCKANFMMQLSMLHLNARILWSSCVSHQSCVTPPESDW